jgi:hypothetical protein
MSKLQPTVQEATSTKAALLYSMTPSNNLGFPCFVDKLVKAATAFY